MSEEVKVSPTVRGNLSSIIGYIVLAIATLMAGIYVHVEWPIYPLVIADNTYMMDGLLGAKFLYFVSSVSLLISVYKIIYIRATRFEIDAIAINCAEGIIVRKYDNLEMTSIKDFSKLRSFSDLFMGTRSINVDSTDKSHPRLIIKGLKKEDAEEVFEFLKLHSVGNITELAVSREVRHRKRREKQNDDKQIGA